MGRKSADGNPDQSAHEDGHWSHFLLKGNRNAVLELMITRPLELKLNCTKIIVNFTLFGHVTFPRPKDLWQTRPNGMEAEEAQGPSKRPKAANAVLRGADVIEPAVGALCVKSAGGGARQDGEVDVPALGSTSAKDTHGASSQEPGESSSMLPFSMHS